MFEKVLVCLDKSPESEEILPYIYREARHFNKVVLLTVVNVPVVTLPVGVPGENSGPIQTSRMLNEFKQALDAAPAYLDEKAQQLRDDRVDVETVVLEGTPAEAIVDYIRKNDVQMLAIGTHGHSGFREIAMGEHGGIFAEKRWHSRNANIPEEKEEVQEVTK